MDKAPNMISTKDLLYLEDMFNWHMNICKKSKLYIENANEEDIKKELKKTYDMHKNCLNKIINILE